MAKLKLRTLNDIILDLQDICDTVGNHKVEGFGATSDGRFSIDLWLGDERKRYYFSQFDDDRSWRDWSGYHDEYDQD